MLKLILNKYGDRRGFDSSDLEQRKVAVVNRAMHLQVLRNTSKFLTSFYRSSLFHGIGYLICFLFICYYVITVSN